MYLHASICSYNNGITDSIPSTIAGFPQNEKESDKIVFLPSTAKHCLSFFNHIKRYHIENNHATALYVKFQL